MKRIAIAFLVAQCLAMAVSAADVPQDCRLCAGAVMDLASAAVPPSVIPLLVRVRQEDLATAATSIDALTPAQRAKTTVIVSYAIDKDKDALLDVEEHTKAIVEWARAHGKFDAIGVSVSNAEPAIAGYATKRLAVTAQGLNVAELVAADAPSVVELSKLFDGGAQSYFDLVITDGENTADVAKWLAEHDPAKKIEAVVTPQSPNVFFDLAQAFANGATVAYQSQAVDPSGIANLNSAFAGEYAYDSTSKLTVLNAQGNPEAMPVLTFVRGEDLRTVLVPKGDAAAPAIVSLPSDRFTRPRRVDAAGDRDVTDVGRKEGHYLIGMQAVKQPFVLTVDHAEKPDANITKETVSVATERGISVEEIIRNHQAYKAFQESIEPRYIALDTTKMRFGIGAGSEVIEATIAGDYFADPSGRNDWLWQEFLVNGVKWKYGRMPELPLIQPEKVSQLPLDIHLTNEYRYQLVRETELNGYPVYEVRFEPPANAPAALPLYRGTVWIDKKSWARIRIQMVELNLTGEVLSNEERVDFQPFARDTWAPLNAAAVAKTDPRAIAWLPFGVEAQQVISAAGRGNIVLRSTTFSNFRIDPSDFEARHQEASASDKRMVRETEAGLRYLERRPNGERVVKEGFDRSRTFMLGGIHHDAGLEYPVVPLGGIDYFNFDLFNRGIQANVFFAGVVVAANATQPNYKNTHTNVGVDFFGIAIPTVSSVFRNGFEVKSEQVKSLPTNLTMRVGHPVAQFGKVDVSMSVSHETYQRAEETGPNYVVPHDTFILSPSIEAQYSRWGYTFTGFYDYNKRTSWGPWGLPNEFSPDQQTFTNFGGSFGKAFYLPKFQQIGVDLNYVDGQRLDRFSKYELSFFGAQRVHGIESGSVRAERAIVGHLKYGFVFSDQLRLEMFYDHALINDAVAGYHSEPFQGVGIAGQMVGPYGTLMRLDIGKTIGRNRQDGFVANVVLLKLF